MIHELNPADERHFLVRGTLLVGGQEWRIFLPGHADDLLPGADGHAQLAERIRAHEGARRGDPDARWLHIEVVEHEPPDQLFDGPADDLFPL